MKCLNCGKDYDDELDSCPFCQETTDIVLDNDIPKLKDDTNDDVDSDIVKIIDEDIDLSKTISISSFKGTDEEDELSLIDEINKQIDTVNIEEESSTDLKKETEDEQEQEKEVEGVNDLSTEDSFKKRKKVFFTTALVCLFLSLAIICGLFLSSRDNQESVSSDYMAEYEKALQKYYDTEEIDDVVYIIESIKEDDEKVSKIQSKTRTMFDSWILLYINEEASNLDEYDIVTDKYRELLNGLHSYAVAKVDNNYITALTDVDYEELNKQIEDVYSDCIVFYEALTYYNDKDYNRAYYMFDVIEDSNSYYEKSQSYKRKIIDNVLNLLNNDITKVSAGIDDLDDNGKLQIYVNVEEIIISYNSVYNNLDLADNNEYQTLLNQYTSKVSLYTDKIANGESNKQESDELQDETTGEAIESEENTE